MVACAVDDGVDVVENLAIGEFYGFGACDSFDGRDRLSEAGLEEWVNDICHYWGSDGQARSWIESQLGRKIAECFQRGFGAHEIEKPYPQAGYPRFEE